VDQSLRDAGERAPPAQPGMTHLPVRGQIRGSTRRAQHAPIRQKAEPWRACSPARAVANVVTDLVDAWDDEEKPARLARVNVVHGHRLAGNELPTERSSKPVAFAFACLQPQPPGRAGTAPSASKGDPVAADATGAQEANQQLPRVVHGHRNNTGELCGLIHDQHLYWLI
jgi:hypothetical protein